jgi:hypothetical protein
VRSELDRRVRAALNGMAWASLDEAYTGGVPEHGGRG